MARIKTVHSFLLLFGAAYLCQVNCQDCSFTGWSEQDNPCPEGNTEIYLEKSEGQSNRLCCVTGSNDGKILAKQAGACRMTDCVSSTSSDICTVMAERYIQGIKLEYEEILRDNCLQKDGEHALTGLCCQVNSTEGLLATTLGAEPHEFPHQAKLKLPGHCGGTVYNKNFIITAAHCVVGKESFEVEPPDEMKVILGTNIGDKDEAGSDNVYTVKRVIPHEHYSRLKPNPELEQESPRIFNDIALLELNEEIQFSDKVKALQIAPKKFESAEFADNAVIVGWGTTDTLDISIHLQKANFIIRKDKTCFEYSNDAPWPHMNKKEPQLLCVGGIREGKWSPTAGGGDSGGPAICRAEDGRALLCGVTSFGGDDEACLGAQTEDNCPPSVYAEVAFFHDWIKKHAGNQDPATLYQPHLYGQVVQNGMFDHQVHITSDDGKPCGGTLIAPDAVITAAQCIMEDDGEGRRNVQVTAGIRDLNGEGQTFDVKGAVVLPGFKREGKRIDPKEQRSRVIMTDNFHKNDLALLKLDGAVDIDPAGLPEIPSGEEGGTSRTAIEIAFPRNATVSRSSSLMQREFHLLDKSECQVRMNRMKRGGLNVTVDENVLCGVEKFSGGSQCDRELGGGLICQGANGKEILCGVQIFRLCEWSIPNGFMHMSLYRDWVTKAMEQLK